MAEIKTIGIVTSGNDAPGMNSAIRAVTRGAIYNGLKVKAVLNGVSSSTNTYEVTLQKDIERWTGIEI